MPCLHRMGFRRRRLRRRRKGPCARAPSRPGPERLPGSRNACLRHRRRARPRDRRRSRCALGAYRVFGCGGSTSSDIILAAMERALGDHMDVINMSFGSDFQWPQYPTAVGADRLVTKHGIVVVASIGNRGANGLYSSGAPGVGANVIGVASFDNVKVQLPYFTVPPVPSTTPAFDGKVGYTQATGSPNAPISGGATLVRTGTLTSAADACSALTAGSLTGKVALIRRGTGSFYAKST